MSNATYFDQECPTCGRRLRVRIEYLGKKVSCRHCHAKFEAWDAASGQCPPASSGIHLLNRVEELLATANIQKVQASH
jgi:PHP family Zn ribbon phosphoesterase